LNNRFAPAFRSFKCEPGVPESRRTSFRYLNSQEKFESCRALRLRTKLSTPAAAAPPPITSRSRTVRLPWINARWFHNVREAQSLLYNAYNAIGRSHVSAAAGRRSPPGRSRCEKVDCQSPQCFDIAEKKLILGSVFQLVRWAQIHAAAGIPPRGSI